MALSKLKLKPKQFPGQFIIKSHSREKLSKDFVKVKNSSLLRSSQEYICIGHNCIGK